MSNNSKQPMFSKKVYDKNQIQNIREHQNSGKDLSTG